MAEAKHKGRELTFTTVELSEMLLKCKSLLDLDLTEFAEPTKEEVLELFEEAIPKMGIIEEERQDILVATFNYERTIRDLETEILMLRSSGQGDGLEHLHSPTCWSSSRRGWRGSKVLGGQGQGLAGREREAGAYGSPEGEQGGPEAR